jgi:hypothetical protein
MLGQTHPYVQHYSRRSVHETQIRSKFEQSSSAGHCIGSNHARVLSDVTCFDDRRLDFQIVGDIDAG